MTKTELKTEQIQYCFPKSFWWGSAASATQTEGAADEGGKGKNIWDHWYEKEPTGFLTGWAQRRLRVFTRLIEKIFS